jgi:hypothetical protein
MSKLGTLLLGLALQSCVPSDDTGSLGGAFVPGTDESPGITFPVVLSPACATAGLFATGAATVELSDDASRIVVSRVRYAALSTALTSAHFHHGAPAVPGPIIFDLGDAADTNTFTRGDYPAAVPDGAPADYGAFVDEMIAGNTYVDIHTESCTDGEIRGQLR